MIKEHDDLGFFIEKTIFFVLNKLMGAFLPLMR